MADINMDWVERLRAPRYIWSQIAAHNPQRGILCREQESQQQLLTWDVETGETHPLTQPVPYALNATLSPDGEFVTYLTQHPTHEEVFQYVRVPYAGGTPQPMALTALMYASPHIEEAANARIGFTAVGGNGYSVQIWTPTSTKPLFSFESEVLAYGPALSADGTIAVVATLHSDTSESTHLEAYNIDTGEKIGQLELPDTPLEAVKFAPAMGDARLLVQAREGLYTRPLVWDVRTGKTDRLGLEQVERDYHAWDWIDDMHLLLQGQGDILHYVLSYNIENQEIEKLSLASDRNVIFAARLGNHLAIIEENETHSTSLTYSEMVGKDHDVVMFQPLYGTSLYRPERTAYGTGFTTFTATEWRQRLFASENGQFVDHSDDNSLVFNVSLEDIIPFTSITAWMDQRVTCLHHIAKPKKNILFGTYAVDVFQHEARTHRDSSKNKQRTLLLTAHNIAAALALVALHHGDLSLWAGGVVVRPILDWVHLYEAVSPPEKAMMRLWFGGSPTDKPNVWRDVSPLRQTNPLKVPVKLLYHPHDTLTPIQHIQTYAANNPTVELIDISRDLVGPAHEQQERLITRMLEAGMPLIKGTS